MSAIKARGHRDLVTVVGHAAPAFIAQLAETMETEPDELKALLADRREHFAKLLPADAEPQEGRGPRYADLQELLRQRRLKSGQKP